MGVESGYDLANGVIRIMRPADCLGRSIAASRPSDGVTCPSAIMSGRRRVRARKPCRELRSALPLFYNCGMKAGLVAALVLFGASGASATCTLGKIADLPTTMFQMRPLITAKVNGVAERFLIETGAGYSIMSPGAAAEMKLKLTPAPEGLMVTGVGGAVQASVTTVRDLTLAGVPLHNVEFLVAGSDFGVAGVIGQNILGLADVEYDLANGVVRLLRPSGCGSRPLVYWAKPTQSYSAVDISFDNPKMPLATTTVYINGVKFRALFDTGGSRSMLSRAAAAKAGISVVGPGVTDAGSLYGIGRRHYSIWVAPVDSFKIGDEEIKHTKLAIFDTSLTNADMILGPDFFLSHHLLIANTASKAYFTYNGGPVFNLATNPEGPSEPATGSAPSREGSNTLDAAALSRRGTASASRRAFDPAIADLTKAIELAPTEEDYVYERAVAYQSAGKPFLAMADLDRALVLKPDDARALVTRAFLRFSGHDRENAAKDLDAASNAVAKEADIRLSIAMGYDRGGLRDRALDQYTLWIAAHPDDSRWPAALNGRCWARALLDRDLDKALVDCNGALRADPKEAGFLDSRGLVFLRLGQFYKAIADYDASLAFRPKGAWSFYGRGLAKLRLGDAAGGMADIAAAKAINEGVPVEAASHGLTP